MRPTVSAKAPLVTSHIIAIAALIIAALAIAGYISYRTDSIPGSALKNTLDLSGKNVYDGNYYEKTYDVTLTATGATTTTTGGGGGGLGNILVGTGIGSLVDGLPIGTSMVQWDIISNNATFTGAAASRLATAAAGASNDTLSTDDISGSIGVISAALVVGGPTPLSAAIESTVANLSLYLAADTVTPIACINGSSIRIKFSLRNPTTPLP